MPNNTKKDAEGWLELNTTYLDLMKTIAKLEDEKAAKERTEKLHALNFEARKTTLEGLWLQYHLSRENCGGKEIWDYEWQAPAFVRAKYFGGATFITESQGPKVAANINRTAANARFHLAAMQNVKKEIDDLILSLNDANTKRDEIKTRISDFRLTHPDLVSTTPDATVPAPLPLKKIHLVGGKTVLAQSIMKLDKEVRYRDEKGEWQTLSADRVEKIDANDL